MIKLYENGNDLVRENRTLLDANPYLSAFFLLDAPLLTCTDRTNYALRAGEGENTLLAMKVAPYDMLLFGNKDSADELFSYLIGEGYEINGLLGSEDVCEAAADALHAHAGIDYCETLAMDFMECREVTEPSSHAVTTPTENDLEEILECCRHFIIDCGLTQTVDPEKTRQRLSYYRVLRVDGKIVSMACSLPETDKSMKICNVYTRPEYRGCGYARQVVNTIKNEILSGGMIATLNVDKKNPISNALYRSLGFVRVFSQGVFNKI